MFFRPINYLVWFASQASTQRSKVASFIMLMFEWIPTRCYFCNNHYVYELDSGN